MTQTGKLNAQQMATLKEMGIRFAETEADIWADQNSELNTNKPRQMPEWTFGTYEGSMENIFPGNYFSAQDEEDGTRDEMIIEAENVMDRAASKRWAEIAEEFNAGHEARVQAWKENQ